MLSFFLSRLASEEFVISAKVFVGNLNYGTTKEDLVSVLSECGEIVDAFLPTDRESGRPRGFAFITFANNEQARACIERFNGHELGGRRLNVNQADDRPRRGGPGGGGRGGPRPRDGAPPGRGPEVQRRRSDMPPRPSGGDFSYRQRNDGPPRGGGRHDSYAAMDPEMQYEVADRGGLAGAARRLGRRNAGRR